MPFARMMGQLRGRRTCPADASLPAPRPATWWSSLPSMATSAVTASLTDRRCGLSLPARSSPARRVCKVTGSTWPITGAASLRIHTETGRVLWKSEALGGPVQGGLAATPDAVYVGAEDLKCYKLNAADGRIAASRQVFGQSFRLQWPVIHGANYGCARRRSGVWAAACNDPLLAQATDLADEETKYFAWLNGAASFGPCSSKNDWKSYFALNLADLTEPFQIPCGPSEGCGQPPNPPAVTQRGDFGFLVANALPDVGET